MSKVRLAWLSTHPIQYQAPLLRSIAQSPGIDLTALFFSNFSTRKFSDPEFGRTIEWDTPLLEGYKHEFLPGTGEQVQSVSFLSPKVNGLKDKLTRDNFDAVLIQGWQNIEMVKAAWWAKKAGLTVLLRCEATDHVTTSTGLKKQVRELLVKFLLKQVDYCLAIGTHNRNFYLARGIPENRIGCMPYCVDNQHFFSKSHDVDLNLLRQKYNLSADKKIILYSGKLIKRKFPDHLLKAYAELSEPRPYLLYAGDGELSEELKRFKEEKNLSEVRFLGFCNQSELPGLYALADIFVLPAINETWGLVVNEAMNAECAIVTTTNVGSAMDLVQNGKNGIVIPPCDIPRLTEALNICIQNGTAKEMGKNSLKIIKNWGIPENVWGLRKILGLNQGEA